VNEKGWKLAAASTSPSSSITQSGWTDDEDGKDEGPSDPGGQAQDVTENHATELAIARAGKVVATRSNSIPEFLQLLDDTKYLPSLNLWTADEVT